MTLTFTIPGPPVPWERDQQDRNGRRYTSPRTRAFEKHARACAAVAMLQAGLAPWGGPCRIERRFFVPDLRRRDEDNLSKSLNDSLTGVVWADDSWVVASLTEKYLDRANPRTECEVEFLDEWDAWKAEI